MPVLTDIGAVLNIADKLIQVLESPLIKGMRDWKSDLENLSNTVRTIKNMLLDVETKQPELSYEEEGWIARLKDAVYDADDLFDECLTKAKRKQLVKDNGNLSRKLHDFFSSKNRMIFAYTTSQDVRNIKNKLDAIADDHSKYKFEVGSRPIVRRGEETCSYVYAPHVLGRESDVKAVLKMLFDENVGFVAVVGVGGLGKTTLAQLVYNNEQEKPKFDIKLWVCVSGETSDGNFDVKGILAKIYEVATGQKRDNDSTLQVLQSKVQKLLGGKTYMLVLDDVWNEDREKWFDLRNFLMVGGEGSKVLVTTRSKITATMIAERSTYELEGLSSDDSWCLFKLTAFAESEAYVIEPQLIEIGKEIVEKCSNVPLAIKVMGTLLYGQGKSKWLSFQKTAIAEINNGENKIMTVLKLSYHSLESPLKSCFSYCAIFPKDFSIKKDMLISLWMAQGYIVPFDVGQSIEDAGEEYFSILLRRCFFHDVKLDDYGEVSSCKMHDLMHEVAQSVAGKEIRVIRSMTDTQDKKIRHLSHVGGKFTGEAFTEAKIRTFLQGSCSQFPVDESLLGKWLRLRVLDLSDLDMKSLPKSVGKLLHLRYLDLSWNRDLEYLPKSITKLNNLLTLNLSFCSALKELPNDLSKLNELRHLHIVGCDGLSCMPPRMVELRSLCVLTNFFEGARNLGLLEDLKSLNNLKHCLDIRIDKNSINVKDYHEEGRYLCSKEHLKEVKIVFPYGQFDTEAADHAYYEGMMEKLQPHPNLKGFKLYQFHGKTVPWQDNLVTFLPNLVKIKIFVSGGLLCLPTMSKLPYLKSLVLECLPYLEYIENVSNSAGSMTTDCTFFPSLVYLKLSILLQLKGWSVSCVTSQPSFPRLSELDVFACDLLSSFPACPRLEKLSLVNCNEALEIKVGGNDEIRIASNSCSTSTSSDCMLREIKIDRLGYLRNISETNLLTLSIESADELETLSEAKEVFKRCSTSLLKLEINTCRKLICLSEIKHLSALQSLVLFNNPSLVFSEDQDDDVHIPWRAFHQSLTSLRLVKLDSVQVLPKGIQCLTALQSLTLGGLKITTLPEWIGCLSSLRLLAIRHCTKLTSLPEGMTNLVSLQRLDIVACPYLTETCQNPIGRDWFKIQHIPSIYIRQRDFSDWPSIIDRMQS